MVKIANFDDDYGTTLNGGVVTVASTVSGDVTGTYGSFTVTGINGVAVAGTAANGKVLEATGTATASWQYPELSLALIPGTALGPYAAAGTPLYGALDGSAYTTRAIVTATVATTNGTANYWTLTFNALSATGSATVLGTAVTTAAIGAGTATQFAVTVGTAVPGVEYALTTAATGTPGPLTLRATVFYRRT